MKIKSSEFNEELNLQEFCKDDNVAKYALEKLMNNIKKVTQENLDKNEKASFAFERLSNLIKSQICDYEDRGKQIELFKQYLTYIDIKYFTLKAIYQHLKQKKDNISLEKVTLFLSDNAAKLLLCIKMPSRDLSNFKLYCSQNAFQFNYDSMENQFSKTWLLLLSFKNNFESYKKILSVFDKQILPYFKSPLSLTDFLINSYDLGGSVALLSLSSLFLLMTKYNLEYEDFYTKFYALISPEMMFVKYRSRFLFWADIFLSSINLPAYMIAAFIKKFSRMALISSVEVQYALIPLIQNLFIRHPNLIILLNRKDIKELIEDPFNLEESNLKECKAFESSIWELKALCNHWNPKIKELASFIYKELPKDENDLSDLLETNFSELIEEAFTKTYDSNNINLNNEIGLNMINFFEV